jgi:CheY-like chemotaxis protein
VSTLAAHIPRTLIADDQPDVLAALRLLLKTEGYQTEAANLTKSGSRCNSQAAVRR